MERIRIALMEKRVMLGDIFARFGVGVVGRWALLGDIGRNVEGNGIIGSPLARCQVEALF